ncbi:MAG: hypothetical protein P9L99_13310 [Candidatus Lernaella stagnicola]|nr:hypothetical protein [Candidatus Lernaella stagnicola]
MADLSAERNTKRREANVSAVGIAAATTAYMGLLCLIDSNGYHDPASANAAACVGVVVAPPAGSDYDNSAGDAAAKSARYEFDKQVYLDLDAGTPPTAAYIGQKVFASDNHTASINPEDGPEIGELMSVDAGGCWVLAGRSLGLQNLRDKNLGAAVQTLAAATALVFKPGLAHFPVIGDGDVTLTADFPAPDLGRIIFVIGTSDANKVTVAHDINTNHQGGISAELGSADMIAYIGGTSNWRELFRAIG